MDNSLSPQPTQSSPPNIVSKLPFKLKEIHYIFISLIVFAFILATLIIISRILPQKTTQKPYQKPENIVVAKPVIPLKSYNKKLQQGPFSCPTATLCQEEKSYKKGLLAGNVASKSSIFASFDGTVKVLKTTAFLDNNQKEEFTTIILANPERGLLAYYHFNGTVKELEKVKEKEVIATASGKGLASYENNSFVFKLIKINKDSQSLVDLKLGDFQ